jgi:hypothetical protein
MSSAIRTGSGSGATLAAFFVGVPAGIGLLWALLSGHVHHPLIDPHLALAERYLHHPVEKVELVMFCGALAALAAKLLGSFRDKAALRTDLLPAWDGRAVPPAQAGKLLDAHGEALDGRTHTWIGRRYLAVLEFVRCRGSANELDDHRHALADADAMSLEASYALVRFITWAIPILGFLGTVLGITEAITGIDAEKMEKDISSVTGGLSLAFDATALGLGLTMVLMFMSFLVERAEQSVLEQVDAATEAELGHRFARTAADQTPIVEAVEANTQRLYETAEGLVRRQSDLWAQSFERIAALGRDAAKEQHAQLLVTLGQALHGTLLKHAQRLDEAESQMTARQEKMLTTIGHLTEVLRATSQTQQQGLAEVGERLAQQTAALVQLQQGGGELARLQETLAQNLNALAGAGSFEEAVQSLTAAIHLLTTRVAPVAPRRAA